MPIEYERIRPPKRGRPFPYKCRRCGALATWKEAFASRDRKRRRMPWCICEQCYRQAGGTRLLGARPGQITGHPDPQRSP